MLMSLTKAFCYLLAQKYSLSVHHIPLTELSRNLPLLETHLALKAPRSMLALSFNPHLQYTHTPLLLGDVRMGARYRRQ